MVDEPGVVDDGEVVDDGVVAGDEPLVVPGSHGGDTCPGAEPVCGSLCMRPGSVALGLLRAFVPCCVVEEPLELELVVALPLVVEPRCVFVDVDPFRDVVLLPLVAGGEPFAGVQGTCVVVDGVCPLAEPVVELWAAAYPPTESAAANANAPIVVM